MLCAEKPKVYCGSVDLWRVKTTWKAQTLIQFGASIPYKSYNLISLTPPPPPPPNLWPAGCTVLGPAQMHVEVYVCLCRAQQHMEQTLDGLCVRVAHNHTFDGLWLRMANEFNKLLGRPAVRVSASTPLGTTPNLAVYYSVLCCAVLCCSVLLCAALFRALLHVLDYAMLLYAVLCCAVLCCAVLCHAMLCCCTASCGLPCSAVQISVTLLCVC